MYEGLPILLQNAAKDPEVRVVVLTGTGDYYSSGNDLSNFMQSLNEGGDISSATDQARVMLEKFVKAFIDFPKPIVAAVNGPALGIAVTSLSLVDFVYAVEAATFETPFMKLAQAPEGCSSFTFPLIMSPVKANEILLLGKKFTAREAAQVNLVNAVLPDIAALEAEVVRVVKILASHPPNALQQSKKLIREPVRKQLEDANRRETVLLKDLWASQECMDALVNFFSAKQPTKEQSKL
eukprot:TRINITY_DN5495_c0_g1_i2.p1 TRINITY_DN5495_c0_g1~~TRINITY_DN5495_c0_g1_i2.p1  ORF type:complete len:238 (-),score=72.35 TRINITY_DN5495_c0_g1_i2:49-762(-)